VYIVNHYFDSEDFKGKDIHPFMEYFYKPISSQGATGQGDVFYLARNEVIKNDGLLGFEAEEKDTFYEVFPYYSYSRATTVKLDNQTPWLYSAWFNESMNKKIITRKVNSVLDALAEIGGLVNILLLVVAILIGWIQKFLMESWMVAEIFLEMKGEYYSRKTQDDVPKIPEEEFNALSDADKYKAKVVMRQPFRFRFIRYVQSIFCKLCKKLGKKRQARVDMWGQASLKLRKEFDVMRMIKKMRKFTLLKLIMLRQYQRRILRYAKKYIIKPPKEGREVEMEFDQMSPEARLVEQLSNLDRVMEGSSQNSVDKKILKRLVPQKIYFHKFPEAEAKKLAKKKQQS
jgi:hypothetical protein